MNTFFTKLRLVFSDTSLRTKILFTLGILTLFRFGAAIPIPGVDTFQLERFFAGNQFFGLLNIFSGGGLATLSIVMLGVGPYITASIIMQLMTIIFPRLKEIYQEEGAAGRQRFAQYARMLSVPLAALQGFGLLTLLERQGVLLDLTMMDRIVNIVIVVTGSLILMWLGELITQYGVGNGVSLLIFAGIIGQIPTTAIQLWSTFEVAQLPAYLGFLAAIIAIVAGVVTITEAERPIPITYAKQVRGTRTYGGGGTYLPIRVNNAGVMPIIFALSLLLFPQMLANFLVQSTQPLLDTVGQFVIDTLANQWIYAGLYFVLVFAFTYFYSAITFDPNAISTNLQKSGAFIPGVRPGQPTAYAIGRILNRLTLVGALFLGTIAMLPMLMQAATGIAALAVGGTALLIVVSVAIDFVKQVNAQISMREY